MSNKYFQIAYALFIKIWLIVCNVCRYIDSGYYQGVRLALGMLLAGPRALAGVRQPLPGTGPFMTTHLIGIDGYCLKSKIIPKKYKYRLTPSKMGLKSILQKSRKSLVFRYRHTFLLFLKAKVESRIRLLKPLLKSLSAGGFYYHSLRTRRKVESRKVSGDF